MKRTFILVAVVMVLVAACRRPRRKRITAKAVREMIGAQVSDPTTLTNPSTEPVTGANPDMVNMAVNTLRGEVSKPEDGSETSWSRWGSDMNAIRAASVAPLSCWS